jgi:DNA processing protein
LDKEDISQILGLTLLPDIGPILTRNLIAHCGGAAAVFSASLSHLEKVPGVTRNLAKLIRKADVLQQADKELAWMDAKGIEPIHYWDERFPARLKHCPDAPVLLFYKGTQNLNHHRMVAIVGTRHATHYGRAMTEELVAGLLPFDVVVVSGLAYGIDVIAHRAALEQGIPTIGVVAHGLDRIYPAAHTETARRMMDSGGILTEFLPGNDPDRHNFPRRNRIVAGMIDALVVVETGEQGGAVITASLANGYHRDVFAVPGEVRNPYSSGCNKLIKRQQAILLETADDLATVMNWKTEGKKRPRTQRELFVELNAEEKLLLELLNDNAEWHIDDLSGRSSLTPGTLASTLLSLEFQGLVLCLPGKRYKRN